MSSIVRLALHSNQQGKVTPLEVLRDFADATSDWSYLEDDSQHYAEVKNAPGLVIRHRTGPSSYVDLGFVSPSTESDTVELVVLDRPGSDPPLSPQDRSALLDTFVGVMRDYLRDRPDHVLLEVEENRPNPATS